MWEFDPATNTWIQLADFQGTARRYLTAFSFGNYAYAGLGTNGTNFQDFWLFDESLAAIKEHLNEIELNVFPNPSNGIVNFNLSGVGAILEKIDLTIYSSIGQKVEINTIDTGKNQLDLSRLKKGVYFYTLSYEGTSLKSGQLILTK